MGIVGRVRLNLLVLPWTRFADDLLLLHNCTGTLSDDGLTCTESSVFLKSFRRRICQTQIILA